MTSIQEFYSNQTIFITGATGCLGKLILEKLLRSCPGVRKIYILVRNKPGKSAIERFKDIFNSIVFESIKSSNPDVLEKVSLMSGDCSLPFLGLSAEDQEIFKKEVNCIVHAAANVRFNLDLRTAVFTNVRSVRDLLNLTKEMKNLKSLIYVSTAFTHAYKKTIGEELYKLDVEPQTLIEAAKILDDQNLELMTPYLLKHWPNTYTYTKAVSEEVIRKSKETLPVAIVRPAAITPTYKEPIPGWINNFHGPVGVILGVSLGMLRTVHADAGAMAPLVPADYVVNTVLAAAWKTEKSRREETTPVYNSCSHKSNTITWGELIKFLLPVVRFMYPMNDAIWYCFLQTSPYKTIHKIRAFFYHTLFAHLLDFFLFIRGKRTLAVEGYKKKEEMVNLLSYYTTRHWTIETENSLNLFEELDEKDKETYNFNMKKLNWKEYLELLFIGGRVHLLKDPLSTVPDAKRKMQLFKLAHYICVGFVVCFWCLLFWCVYNIFF